MAEEVNYNEYVGQFFADYWEWLQYMDLPWYKRWFADKPKFKGFTHIGLCRSICLWRAQNNLSISAVRLRETMQQRWIDHGYNEHFPFGGQALFDYEVEADTIYLNIERRAWVNAWRKR